MTNRKGKIIRTPEQLVARRDRKTQKRKAPPPAQMQHASSGSAKKKRREGEVAMDRERDEAIV